MKVIFDGDDTLWATEILYEKARQAAEAELAEHGVDTAKWRELQAAIDLELFETMGFSPLRFVLSFDKATRKLTGDERFANDICRHAQQPVRTRASLRPGAADLVLGLREVGAGIGLITRGDDDVQKKRIAKCGLSFDEVMIVQKDKVSMNFWLMSDWMDGPNDCRISIGDSYRSDIKPALAAGFERCYWVAADNWEREHAPDFADDPDWDPSRVEIVQSLTDLLDPRHGLLER